MPPGSILIVLMALLRVLPALLGSKTCRKYGLGAMAAELRTQIPENGIGPVMAERREALTLLDENCRQCGRCRLGRQL